MPRKRIRSAVSSSNTDARALRRALRGRTQRAADSVRAQNRRLKREIASLQQHQLNLERARTHYADLYDFAPVTYALLDRLGIVLKVNLAATRLLNIERAFLIGHPLLGFVVEEDRRELLEHLRRSRSTRGVVESEVRFTVAGSGDMVICRLYTKQSMYENGVMFPTVIVDQTEHIALDTARLAAERNQDEALRASELARAEVAAKDRFLAVVSHELRTPLTPALFAASRLASWSGLPEQALKLATTIRRNIEFEARLIDDLLDLARINRDSLNLRLETVDVHDVIQEAVAICSGMAEPKGITITTHLNASAHHMSADRTRLRQVFWNLLNNAVKFTDDAGKITVGTADLSHGMLRASIHDTGIGMDAATIQHLFAPFDRQQPGNQSRGGLGLGLAICKGIIGAHRGQLWVASDGRGRGSTFAIEVATVPEPLPAEAARRLPRSTGDEPRSSAPRRVLVIEDDADSSEMLSMFLTQHGYEVEVADSLGAGVSRLMEGWDIVLSDIGLPDGSGLDVARRARQISPPPHRLIAFSGYGSTTDLRASREAGFDAHIVKPIDFDELLGALNGAGG